MAVNGDRPGPPPLHPYARSRRGGGELAEDREQVPPATARGRARGRGRAPAWSALGALAAAVLAVQLAGTHGTAWHWFADAARLLVGDGPPGLAGGLHLYRDRPDLQFGPLSAAAAVPFAVWPGGGAVAAAVAATAAGLVALAAVVAAVERLAGRPVGTWALAAGGAAAVVTWGDVAARTTHLDDAVALLAIAAALCWCAAGGPAWRVVLAAGVAAAAKPWAVLALPLAAVPPGPLPRRLGRVVAAGALVVLTWAPFVLAEPATLDVAGHRITNDPTSVLRALGVDDPATPDWVRPVQLAGCAALASWLAATRRWPAVLLGGVAWRLLLDPGAHRYYTIGLVLGALCVELAARPGRPPWATVAAAVALEATASPWFPAGPGRWLRLAAVLAALVAALASAPARGPAPPGRAMARDPGAGAGGGGTGGGTGPGTGPAQARARRRAAIARSS